MHDLTLWFTPLALMPAVALLTYSTATRYGRLREHNTVPEPLDLRRIALFRLAILGLYTSIVLLTAALLTSAWLFYTGQHHALIVLLFTGASIFTLIFATAQLTREALLAGRSAKGEPVE